MLAIVAVAFLFLSKNPTITILLVNVIFTVLNLAGLINAGVMSIGFMWVAGALLIYIINRR